MCKKCGINNSNCGCEFSSTYNSSSVIFDSQSFVCPSYFTLTSGESLNDVIDTLASEICTIAGLSPNPGDKGPVGDQGIQGIAGVDGNPNGGWLYEYYDVYPFDTFPNSVVQVPISGSQHYASVTALYQIHSTMYMNIIDDGDASLYLYINGSVAQILVIDNNNLVNPRQDSYMFNFQANINANDFIEVKILVFSKSGNLGNRAQLFGGSMLINRITV
tara:strand:+ start:1233 stop:1886 length:654 start_codon:yes stop_codon:yes gene_type:complete